MDFRCRKCGEPETITHVLRDCVFARQVYNLAPLLGSDRIASVHVLEFLTRIKQLICLPPLGIMKQTSKLGFVGAYGPPETNLSLKTDHSQPPRLYPKPFTQLRNGKGLKLFPVRLGSLQKNMRRQYKLLLRVCLVLSMELGKRIQVTVDWAFCFAAPSMGGKQNITLVVRMYPQLWLVKHGPYKKLLYKP